MNWNHPRSFVLLNLCFFSFFEMNTRKAAFLKCAPNEMYGSGWIALSMKNIVDGRWPHCHMHMAILMWFKTMTNSNHYAITVKRFTKLRDKIIQKEIQANRSGLNWMLHIVHCIASVLIFLLFFSIAICKRFTINIKRSASFCSMQFCHFLNWYDKIENGYIRA